MSTSVDANWVAEASRILGVPLNRHTQDKATGPCPKCRTGVDRFIVWDLGNFWCHQCHTKGWWRDVADGSKAIIEAKIERAERQILLRSRMAGCRDWLVYRDALKGDRIALWYDQGFGNDLIEAWGLGWCESCPVCPDRSSLTIPVFVDQILVDIRHRLLDSPNGDKYRSHIAGLVPAIFNIDSLNMDDKVIVLEGEKKAMLSVWAGYKASIGLPGAQFGSRLSELLSGMERDRQIILAFDPDQCKYAEKLALQLGEGVRVADFPSKPDDFLLRYGKESYASVIGQARKIRCVGGNGHGR